MHDLMNNGLTFTVAIPIASSNSLIAQPAGQQLIFAVDVFLMPGFHLRGGAQGKLPPPKCSTSPPNN